MPLTAMQVGLVATLAACNGATLDVGRDDPQPEAVPTSQVGEAPHCTSLASSPQVILRTRTFHVASDGTSLFIARPISPTTNVVDRLSLRGAPDVAPPPTRVATEAAIRPLAVGRTHYAYVEETSGSDTLTDILAVVDKLSGARMRFVSPRARPYIDEVRSDESGSGIYWASMAPTETESLFTVTGWSSTTLATYDLADRIPQGSWRVAGDSLYYLRAEANQPWRERGRVTLERVGLTGGSRVVVRVLDDGTGPLLRTLPELIGVDADAAYLHRADAPQEIVVARFDGTDVRFDIDGGSSASLMGFAGDAIYWTAGEAGNDSLRRTPKRGGASEEVGRAGPRERIETFAFDRCSVFWTTGSEVLGRSLR